MGKSLLEKYIYKIEAMDDKEYLFGAILYHIAPTLISDKPASIITLNNYDRDLNLLWQKYEKEILSICKLNIYEIKERVESKTLFIYNKNTLSKIIYQNENMNFLARFGYNLNLNLDEMLEILKERYNYFCPHEIGVFLGFPIEDVIDFMDYPHKKCLLSGYWKVYNDVDFAMKKFIQYDMAKSRIIKSVLDGMLPSSVLENRTKELAVW